MRPGPGYGPVWEGDAHGAGAGEILVNLVTCAAPAPRGNQLLLGWPGADEACRVVTALVEALLGLALTPLVAGGSLAGLTVDQGSTPLAPCSSD